ncbi:MAG: CopG family transcriptional regulator [Epsilonproteobacteria bacterium]|nr:MAG: CopG family transcriptional regulator [Campylobacterota bacterium]
MLSVRLGDLLEKELTIVSHISHKTKTDIIKEALSHYFNTLKAKEKITPYELGKDLFGTAGSSDGELSVNYKNRYKKMLDEKYNNR